MEDPAAYWSVARERGRAALEASPNPGHYALAAMEEAGHLAAVVTQNTDGLHLDAGTRRLVELHGSGRTVRCLDCGAGETRRQVQERLQTEMPPRCRTCGGIHLKPTVVLFGEALPARAVAEAYRLARHADLMLVAGSSLVVYPAADIPLAAVQAGAPLVIVNAEPTPFDHVAAAVIRGRSGEVLPRLLELVAGG
jgi:NAD-dependent deacetylase